MGQREREIERARERERESARARARGHMGQEATGHGAPSRRNIFYMCIMFSLHIIAHLNVLNDS